MPTVNVVIGKSTKPAKFYHKGNRISVDTAFGMYQKKARFVVDGKTLNLFGAQWPCPEGTTWNTRSKQCVSTTGKVGKDIRKAQATKIQKLARRRTANRPPLARGYYYDREAEKVRRMTGLQKLYAKLL
jgi:hypothetical protein